MTSSINFVENSNPHFGNFGYDYQQHDLNYIQRINRHRTLVSIVNDGLQEQRQIFIHNGGSLKRHRQVKLKRLDFSLQFKILDNKNFNCLSL